MNRRNAFRLIPLSIAGIAGLADRTFAQDRGLYADACPKRSVQDSVQKPLSIRYTEKVREILAEIRRTQSDTLLEAAYQIARTHMRGGTCWYSWDMGHSLTFDLVPDRNGVPEIFRVGYNPSQSKSGDLFLANIFGGPHEDLAKKNIFVIGSPVPWSQDARGAELIVYPSAMHRIRPYSNIWIETGLTTHGAIMRVPGMPAPVGPVSGIVGMATFWMMMADACRILAREGRPISVRGDEPPLAVNTPRASLDAPLMGEYYDTVVREIEMIGMELGNIRKIAAMAADAVLGGGKVWCYSRYRDALSVEAQTRRGGLGLTRGVDVQDGKLVTYENDFKGSPRDMVIMGTFQPDDPVDIQSLDTFRKSGMRVASIGPLTRDTRLPEGRAVYKETDVHVGRMSDTYGLFALPGFERKVCPTSGALQNQIFWAICMEIVEEMIRRTNGNVPGVFYSAAIKGGVQHMNRMNELYKERGY